MVVDHPPRIPARVRLAPGSVFGILARLPFLRVCKVLAVLAQVEQRVAELAIQADLVAAQEFDAVDVITFGASSGVVILGFGVLGRLGSTGEGLSGLDEVEVFIG